MKLHPVASALPMFLSAVRAVVATALMALLISNQAAAQGPYSNLSDKSTPGPQATAAQPTTDVEAPTPAMAQPAPPKPTADALFALATAQDGAQSSSLANGETAAPAKPAKIQPPHHTLGRVMSDVGIGLLATGIILYAGESHYCGSSTISDCSTARNAGLALMPAGGAMMVTGFYLRFHR